MFKMLLKSCYIFAFFKNVKKKNFKSPQAELELAFVALCLCSVILCFRNEVFI